MLFKLQQHNIDGKMYFAVKSLFSNTMASIQLTNTLQTEWFSNDSGVRQGDCISPTMFSLYINDLVNYLKDTGPVLTFGEVSINSLLFADDMVLIAESEQGLQDLLNALYDWCFKWRLKVNESKSKIIHFRKSNVPLTNAKFQFGTCELEKVSHYKYLGVLLDENLNFLQCTKALADSGGRALGAIISKFKSLKNVGFNTFQVMYNSGVKPVIEYGSGVWGHVKGGPLNAIQNRAMRFYLGVHKFSPNCALLADMGWLSAELSRCLCRIRLWNRLIEMEENRLTKKIFNYDYDQHKCNWSSEMKVLFGKIGVDCFNLKSVCDISHAVDALNNVMLDAWKKEIVKKPKLRTFIQFKQDMETEDYVKKISSRHARSLLSQFRHGILPLKIETGRFINTDVADRICELCQNHQVEDEFHFLCVCPLYSNIRKTMYDKCIENYPYFATMTKELQFVYLMKNQWKFVSNFLVAAWKLRQNTIYNPQ